MGAESLCSKRSCLSQSLSKAYLKWEKEEVSLVCYIRYLISHLVEVSRTRAEDIQAGGAGRTVPRRNHDVHVCTRLC